MTNRQSGLSTLQRLVFWVLIGVAGVYALQSYSALYNTGFNAPFLDQYVFYQPYLEKPFPQNVVQSENGHRPIFPALVRVAEITYFHGDQSLQRLVGAVLVSAAWLGLLLMCLFRQGYGLLRQGTIILSVTLAILWMGNVRMLVHGNEQLHVYGVISGLIMALGLMYRMREQPTVAGFSEMVAAAFFATFSFGNGLVVFPTLMVMALLLRWPWRWQLSLTGATCFAVLLYTRWLPSSEVNPLPALGSIPTGMALTMSWLNSGVHAAWLSLAQWDVSRIDYLGQMSMQTGWLGHAAKLLVGENVATDRTLQLTFWLGLICTVLVVAVFLYHARHGVQSRLQFVALSLLVFSAGTASLIVLFRVDYFQIAGSSQLFADRYVPWSCLWWLGLGLYPLSLMSRTGGKWRDLSAGTLILFIAWALSLSHITNLTWATIVRQHLVEHALAIANGFEDPVELAQLSTGSLEQTQRTLALLKQHNLGQFYTYPATPGTMTVPHATPALAAHISKIVATDRFVGWSGVWEFSGSLPITAADQHFDKFSVFNSLGKYCGTATISHAGDAPSPLWRIGPQVKLGFYGLMFCKTAPEQTRLYGHDQTNTWFDLGPLR